MEVAQARFGQQASLPTFLRKGHRTKNRKGQAAAWCKNKESGIFRTKKQRIKRDNDAHIIFFAPFHKVLGRGVGTKYFVRNTNPNSGCSPQLASQDGQTGLATGRCKRNKPDQPECRFCVPRSDSVARCFCLYCPPSLLLRRV